LVLPATVWSGCCRCGILYLWLEIRPPAHCRASVHFFSEISRLRWARDLGSRSTPRAYGVPAASFAHSSAFSLPAMPLWAGHHRISMAMSGLGLRSVAMCCLARIAYFWPGPGSFDTMRLMAGWAFRRVGFAGGQERQAKNLRNVVPCPPTRPNKVECSG
jgi:hypothetical protein